MSIPVVDFSASSLNVEDIDQADLRQLSGELKMAFTEVGFVFLENTGISQAEVDDVMDASRRFFLQPDHLKRPFSRKTFPNNPNHGWVSLEAERLNPQKPGDLKEAFNLSSLHPDIKWPTSEAQAGLRETQTAFFHRCKELSLRVLRVMAHSLDVDPDVFLNAHRLIGTDENGTTLRSLYYPPVRSELAKEGQLRCGEHSDYGSITLLFQSAEGLQVRRRSEFCSPRLATRAHVSLWRSSSSPTTRLWSLASTDPKSTPRCARTLTSTSALTTPTAGCDTPPPHLPPLPDALLPTSSFIHSFLPLETAQLQVQKNVTSTPDIPHHRGDKF
ncbi:uncharacterized protein LOC133502035 isoform X1 [Syngnathoides biaculeatus]|uniref:uncharacterized protein LOC133502035 isoform X1 n=1 Tax=Syngnathoides biaculeatus TaxID=300417 RepID=UPI002ADDC117|nr:uncharacterized protein LOC133502035 isoform X1 [Syngnathoides biaculeatus]